MVIKSDRMVRGDSGPPRELIALDRPRPGACAGEGGWPSLTSRNTSSSLMRDYRLISQRMSVMTRLMMIEVVIGK